MPLFFRYFFAALVLSSLSIAHGESPGQSTTVTPLIVSTGGYGYYLCDWGDGVTSVSGVRHDQASSSHDKFGLPQYGWEIPSAASATMTHTWEQPGTFNLKYAFRSLGGKTIFKDGPQVVVTGNPKALPRIAAALSYSSGSVTGGIWTSAPQNERERDEWSALTWKEETPIDSVRIKTADGRLFPSTFCLEYTMDGGNRWLSVPTANFSAFPDSPGKIIEIPLHGLMGDGVRVTARLLRQASPETYRIQLGRLEAIAGGPPVYTWKGMDAVQQAAWNNLWTIYGTAAAEVHLDNDAAYPSSRPFQGGDTGFGSSEWLDWNILKFGFYDDKRLQDQLKAWLRQAVVDPDGFVWAAPNNPKHLNISRHYITNACYVSAVADYFLISRDRSFLDTPSGPMGKTLLEKVRMVMDYQLHQLHGESGILTITDPITDGTSKGLPDTYWDFWLAGYQSVNENIAFYRSLLRMKEMESALGETERAESLGRTADLVKQKFNETFWDPVKGRFIGWIDKNGVHYDYGSIYLNLPAITEGIASPEHARAIMSWVNGSRTVAGDDSGGADIYYFKIAPRSTTYEAAHGPPMFITYDGAITVGKGGTAAFGVQSQNGGVILYLSYYDLLARLKVFGPDDAWNRMQAILSDFGIDQLRHDPTGNEAWTEEVGIIGEFPESGLVPVSLLWGWLGLHPDADGLTISPKLATSWQEVTVHQFTYAGKSGTLIVQSGLTSPTLTWNGSEFELRVPADKSTLITPSFNPSTK